jgi:hypothetical protein
MQGWCDVGGNVTGIARDQATAIGNLSPGAYSGNNESREMFALNWSPVVDALEQLEEVLTLDQAHDLAHSTTLCRGEEPHSTQQMLDNLLGHLDDDDCTVFLNS